MNRRSFLKTTGVALGIAAIGPNLALAHTKEQKKIYTHHLADILVHNTSNETVDFLICRKNNILIHARIGPKSIYRQILSPFAYIRSKGTDELEVIVTNNKIPYWLHYKEII